MSVLRLSASMTRERENGSRRRGRSSSSSSSTNDRRRSSHHHHHRHHRRHHHHHPRRHHHRLHHSLEDHRPPSNYPMAYEPNVTPQLDYRWGSDPPIYLPYYVPYGISAPPYRSANSPTYVARGMNYQHRYELPTINRLLHIRNPEFLRFCPKTDADDQYDPHRKKSSCRRHGRSFLVEGFIDFDT